MTQLQHIQLDILTQFLDICRQLNLTYYLVCGSALGAAKYQGFIPWDDDIDVALPREDYQRFLAEAPALLPAHLFLQNFRTDPEFPHIFSKLRDSRTTFVEVGLHNRKMHHGIFIDIFPLDGYPDDPIRQRHLELWKKFYSWQQYCALEGDAPLRVRLRNRLFRLLGCHKRTARTLEKMEALFLRYPAKTSAIWCNHGNWQGRLEYAPRSQYGQGCWGKFEGLSVRLPEDFDAYLTQKYGDWQADLPKHQQYGHHFTTRFSTDRPYTDCL